MNKKELLKKLIWESTYEGDNIIRSLDNGEYLLRFFDIVNSVNSISTTYIKENIIKPKNLNSLLDSLEELNVSLDENTEIHWAFLDSYQPFGNNEIEYLILMFWINDKTTLRFICEIPVGFVPKMSFLDLNGKDLKELDETIDLIAENNKLNLTVSEITEQLKKEKKS